MRNATLAAVFLSIISICSVSSSRAQQAVFLDFSGTDGSIAYSMSDMSSIKSIMESHYAPFDFTFSLSAPMTGPFSTITFNAGGTGGLAEQIDFGNTDKSDSAVVNVSGLGFATTDEINMASAIIGSHELGHLQGLRHGDSFGPIGFGVNGTPGVGPYLPDYPGPATAFETNDHIMASPGATGQSLAEVSTPSWFSERSAIKLAFNEGGTFGEEIGDAGGTIGTAQAITLEDLIVPNTIVMGLNDSAPAFDVDAISIQGEISTGSDVDVYSFEGLEGDLINIEVLSAVSSFKTPISGGLWDVLDTNVRVLDDTGSVIPYYTGTASNDDEFETFDSILIDLLLPGDGMFFVEIDNSSFATTDTGNYELFIHRFNGAVPEPASSLLLLAGLMGLACQRRR